MATVVRKVAVSSLRGSNIVYVDEANATYAVVKASAGTVFSIEVDNSANPNTYVWLKLYDDATPVVGTDTPEMIIRAPKGDTTGPIYSNLGRAFATAITAACVLSGGTAGTDSPANDVTVTLYIN